jgi:DNA-binding PadR family transcriptional regulator
MYFGVLKRLGWVETTSETEPSAIQDNYPPVPQRTYYRLTEKGIEAGDEFWSNLLFTLYPEIVPSHMKKSE